MTRVQGRGDNIYVLTPIDADTNRPMVLVKRLEKSVGNHLQLQFNCPNPCSENVKCLQEEGRADDATKLTRI